MNVRKRDRGEGGDGKKRGEEKHIERNNWRQIEIWKGGRARRRAWDEGRISDDSCR